jgi:putative nucleotidyltransferase-like protein
MTDMRTDARSRAIMLVGAALAVDAVTAEVVRAMHSSHIRPVLLKGPTIARWLYASEAERSYQDTDLLVSPQDLDTGEGILRRLGFACLLEAQDSPGSTLAANPWARGEQIVDLHRTLAGADREPAVVWDVVTRDTDEIVVGSERVAILSVSSRAMHLAMHATQHGASGRPTLRDLERAIAQLDRSVWEEALARAREIGAEESFALGLRLHPRGRELADSIDATSRASVEARLIASTPPPVALGIENLIRANGLGTRLRLLLRKLFPTARFMRQWSPAARQGRIGLVLSYFWRPVWLLLSLPRAVGAWRHARSIARDAN